MTVPGECGCGPECSCGACRGIRDATPIEVLNRPGLSAIRYRAGDHARFKASMLAAISRGRRPALRGLTTRRDDDFSIALLDAFAAVADILTFYQERIANESYLRTAAERLSVGHVAALIGYELRPGSAARAGLAFQMTDAPGAPERLTLPVGSRAQSTPGQDEKPQPFETSEEIELRPSWNAIPLAATRPQPLSASMPSVLLKGAALNLHAGDGMLFVFEMPGDTDFTAVFRRIGSVEVDARGDWTRARLEPGGAAQAKFDALPLARRGVFAFRRQAGLFGHNAPNFALLNAGLTTKMAGSDWDASQAGNTATRLFLDAPYREVLPGSWAVWESTDASGSPMIAAVSGVAEQGRSAFGLSAKVTRLDLTRGKGVSTPANPGSFAALRSIGVLVQSERLEPADVPVEWPVPVVWPPGEPLPAPGKTLALARAVEGLVPGRRVSVEGDRLRVEALRPLVAHVITPSGIAPLDLAAGDVRSLWMSPIPLDDGSTFFGLLQQGQIGVLWASPGAARVRHDPGAELATIAQVSGDGRELTLKDPLVETYDPPSVRVNANVVAATHGESVQEIFEGGDAARAFQRFPLKQTPLTYVAATTPSGVASTLRVWVDEVEWHEVPSLYGRGPRDRVFVTRADGDGRRWIQFGDGVTGARLPTGARNVRAEYRRGVGAAGNLAAGRINLLMSRPLGLKEVVNPLPSADGKDAERVGDARRNAPLTVLTLDRVVSLRDYEDFARAFAGVTKAAAQWTWFGQTRGVFITVAGEAGAALSAEGRQRLRDAIAAWGDPHVALHVANHAPVAFRVGLRVKIDPDRQAAPVLGAVEASLRAAFSFERMEFGQDVSAARTAAAAQAVAGVVAVQVAALHRADQADPEAGLAGPLPARIPRPGQRGEVLPAELLTLDPGPLALLEAMA